MSSSTVKASISDGDMSKLDEEAMLFFNISAKDYLASINKYLTNLSLVKSWPRPSDDIPLDRSAGVAWIVIIPVLYFISVAIILGILLGYFWYIDKQNIDTESSDLSSSSLTRSNARREAAAKNDHSLLPGSFVRNSLNTAIELEAMSRTSVASKGSVRSLGTLTDTDLTMPNGARASIRSVGLSQTNRRLSRSIPETFTETSDEQKLYLNRSSEGVSAGSQRLGISVRSMQRTLTTVTTTTGSKSLSPDSLNDNVSKESLRASMESHKFVWMSDVDIKPDTLYDENANKDHFASQSRSINKGRSGEKDKYINKIGTDKMQHFFDNPLFTAEHAYIQELDVYPMKDAIRAKPTNQQGIITAYSSYGETQSQTNSQEISDDFVPNPSSTSASSNIPSSLLLGFHISESSSVSDVNYGGIRGHVSSHSNEERRVKKPVGRRLFTNDTGTNAYDVLLPKPDNSTSSEDPRINEYEISDESMNVQVASSSQMKTATLSAELDALESQLQSNIEQGISHDRSERSYSDAADLDISSASKVATTSSGELDQSQDSLDYAEDGQDESSVENSTISLPSSISRFHASKTGPYPTPSAGYPLASNQNDTLDKTRSDDSQLDVQEGEACLDTMSLYPNVGSCSQSTAPLSADVSSAEDSLEIDQDEDVFEDAARGDIPDNDFETHTKSAVNKFGGQRKTSLDDSVLDSHYMYKAPNEDGTLSRSPLLQPSGGDDKSKRRHSADYMHCGRVSVEQRLKEFGFIKAKGKNKFFINPSPGKFAGRMGSVNSMFTDSEDGLCTSRLSAVDDCGIENLTMDVPISAAEVMQHERMSQSERTTQSERKRSRPVVTPVLQSSSNSFHVPNNLRDIRQWQQRQLEQKEKEETAAIGETIRTGAMDGQGMIEIHTGKDPLSQSDGHKELMFADKKWFCEQNNNNYTENLDDCEGNRNQERPEYTVKSVYTGEGESAAGFSSTSHQSTDSHGQNRHSPGVARYKATFPYIKESEIQEYVSDLKQDSLPMPGTILNKGQHTDGNFDRGSAGTNAEKPRRTMIPMARVGKRETDSNLIHENTRPTTCTNMPGGRQEENVRLLPEISKTNKGTEKQGHSMIPVKSGYGAGVKGLSLTRQTTSRALITK